MQPSSPLITQSPSSPSFNSYSSNKLAEIAARVVQEFADESELPEPEDTTHNSSSNFFSCPEKEEENNNQQFDVNEDDDNGDDFEFAVVDRSEPRFSDLISADDTFYNGQIGPLYPLFNTKLLLDDQESLPKSKTVAKEIKSRPPLKKLFYEDRETFSCSSSEADDIDSAEPGTYCVWTPKKEEAGGSCKKSSSTGSTSRRWKLKDLLHRSSSDGKETFVFLTPNKEKEKSSSSKEKFGGDDKDKQEKRKDGKKEGGIMFQFQEQYYARSKEGNKRRSYLPYKQVGFLSTVDGVGRNRRNLHPF